MKIQRTALWCTAGLIAVLGSAATLVAQDSAKPAKDMAKDATKQAKDMAKDASKQAKDAADKAVKDATKKAEDMMGGQPEMSPEEQKMMEMWEAAMTPGEHHKHLEQFVGTWDLTMKWWMSPDMPPSESKVSSVARTVLGGRFLVEDVKGTIDMGGQEMPFEGMATMGYDNMKKQYVSTWIDNMNTGVWTEHGTCDGYGKVMTFTGRNFDAQAGGERETKSVITIVDANTRKMEMFAPGEDGKMWRNAEMIYTRKK